MTTHQLDRRGAEGRRSTGRDPLLGAGPNDGEVVALVRVQALEGERVAVDPSDVDLAVLVIRRAMASRGTSITSVDSQRSSGCARFFFDVVGFKPNLTMEIPRMRSAVI